MNRTLSFLFAAALGATLGAFTALEIAPLLSLSHGLAATVGVIIGGLTGYIAVDFRQFCSGVAHAASVAYRANVSQRSAYWDSPRETKLHGICASLALLLVFMYVMIFPLMDPPDPVFVALTSAFVMVVSVSMGHAMAYDKIHPTDGRKLLYWVSPIGLFHFAFFIALPWLVVGLFKIGGWFVRSTGVFMKMLFVAVHSQRRVLCCLDAMLGTLVGYYFGSWPAGTVAGLAFALVSYELVSKRWLKLQMA